jgi:hypothetical protein
MFNYRSKSWLIGAWCTAVVAAAGVSTALGLRAPLAAFGLVVGLTPAVIFQFLGGAPRQTIAEVLRSADTADRTR